MKESDPDTVMWLYKEWGYIDHRQGFGKENVKSVLLRIAKPKPISSRYKSIVYKQENVQGMKQCVKGA